MEFELHKSGAPDKLRSIKIVFSKYRVIQERCLFEPSNPKRRSLK